MNQTALLFLLPLCGSFVLTVAFSRILIPRLRDLKCRQMILEIGPNWHLAKQGTPTMGGLSFFFAILMVASLSIPFASSRQLLQNNGLLWASLLFAVANGVIGMIDDLAKIRNGKNQGLTPSQKFLLQALVATIYLYLLVVQNGVTTSIAIPFFENRIELGSLFYPFAILLMTGFVNSVNLTDGLDGLATSVTLIVGLFFGLFALQFTNNDLSIVAGLLVGGCFGFLLFNKHPAQVFMGDTGSLFLGALVVGIAFLSDYPVLLFFAGIVYWLEALSDIIQVGWFKLTKRRIFRMAPLHHHLELKGLSEVQIVLLFDAVTLLFCIIGFLAFR